MGDLLKSELEHHIGADIFVLSLWAVWLHKIHTCSTHNSGHYMVKNEDTSWTHKTDHYIIFFLMKSESREDEKKKKK